MKAAILGTGSWGTAFGRHLCKSWDEVILWGIDPDQVDAINRRHANPSYFPDIKLPEKMRATLALEDAVAAADAVFVVVPSQAVRETARRIAAAVPTDGTPIICLSKGLELATLKRLSSVLEEETAVDGAGGHHPIGVLLGPSHAEEVIAQLPTAVVLSGRGEGWLRWQRLLSGSRFRVYTNPDLVGVEFSSAFKNVIAIAVGICDGLGFGDNARGALMTRGMRELARLGIAMGGHFETFFGLAGLGDMVTTCTSRHSRNRNFGEAVARGEHNPQYVLDHSVQVVEGVPMTSAALKLGKKHAIELPITQEVHDVLFSGKDPRDAVTILMERALRSEME